jgi:large subunit ribosomal protein L22
MESRAIAKYIRRSPKKIRYIANEVRNMLVSDAVAYLEHMPHMGAMNLRRVILSASANASVKNPDVSTDDLYIKEVVVGAGPVLKRISPRARGRADRMIKRTAHITVVLTDEIGKKG